MANRFHCCATCKHFLATKKQGGGMVYQCKRLGFETKTTYTFTCWVPTEKVKKLMDKSKEKGMDTKQAQ